MLLTDFQGVARCVPFSIFVEHIASAMFNRPHEPRTGSIVVFYHGSGSFRPYHRGNFRPLFTIRFSEVRYDEVKVSVSPFAVVRHIRSRVCRDMYLRFLPVRLFLFEGKRGEFEDVRDQDTNVRWYGDDSRTWGIYISFRLSYRLVALAREWRGVQ